MMKKLLAPILAASLAISASTAFAGGAVVAEEAVEAQPTSSVGILPIILITVALCAALCGGSDNTQTQTSN